MEKLKNVLAPNQALPKTPLCDELSHRSYATPPHDVNNYSHAPQIFENPSQPKWKRLIRESYGKASIIENQIGSKRPIDMVIDISESPCKKLGVSHEDKGNYLTMAAAGSQPRQAP